MIRRIALTGGIATGKSHVLATLARAGVPTNDADLLAREAVAPGSPGLAAIVTRFGASVLDASGALDRKTLANIVFAHTPARRDLEAIVHPYVRAATDAWFSGLDAAHHPYAVVAIPLLYETGLESDFDAVIVTTCTPATQLQRVMHRDGLSAEDAQRRIEAQLPLDDKVRRADYVISTEGTVAETDEQVVATMRALSA